MVLKQSKLVEEALSDKLQEDDVVVKVTEHMQVTISCYMNSNFASDLPVTSLT